MLKNGSVQFLMLTPQLQERMPPYQVTDAKTNYDTLKDLDSKLTQVLKGETTMADARLDPKHVKEKIAVAKTSLSTFGISLEMAQKTLAVDATSSAETVTPEKKGKKRSLDGKKDKKDKKEKKGGK